MSLSGFQFRSIFSRRVCKAAAAARRRCLYFRGGGPTSRVIAAVKRRSLPAEEGACGTSPAAALAALAAVVSMSLAADSHARFPKHLVGHDCRRCSAECSSSEDFCVRSLAVWLTSSRAAFPSRGAAQRSAPSSPRCGGRSSTADCRCCGRCRDLTGGSAAPALHHRSGPCANELDRWPGGWPRRNREGK